MALHAMGRAARVLGCISSASTLLDVHEYILYKLVVEKDQIDKN